MDDSLDPPLRLPPKAPVGELVWVAGGSVDECSVTLRFFGEDLDPDEVTRVLGILPTVSYRKGDIFRGKTYDRIYTTGSWRLRGERSDVYLEDQINTLLDRLPFNLEVWQNLTRRFQSDLFCGLWLKRWNRGLDFTSKTMQRIGERGLALSLDIYADDEEDG
jgi:Domain of unknown function (DUF4279)